VLEQNIYRHQWQPHDLVFWDNRSLIHLAAGCPPPAPQAVPHHHPGRRPFLI
jgi:alpha-ketoglutarate-dependent taurine dioxygenase